MIKFAPTLYLQCFVRCSWCNILTKKAEAGSSVVRAESADAYASVREEDSHGSSNLITETQTRDLNLVWKTLSIFQALMIHHLHKNQGSPFNQGKTFTQKYC